MSCVDIWLAVALAAAIISPIPGDEAATGAVITEMVNELINLFDKAA